MQCNRNTGEYCDNLDGLFVQQHDIEKIRDPHGCEGTCSTAGPECCLQTQRLLHLQLHWILHQQGCDGHPHPS